MIRYVLRNEAFDIVNDADGGHVIADDTVFFHLDDKDFFCVFQDRASLFTNVVEADIAAPVAEKESGLISAALEKFNVKKYNCGSICNSLSYRDVFCCCR